MKKVSVLGLGYIGLPTAAFLAKSGYRVHGFDINKDVIHSLKAGRAHIQEPGLNEMVSDVVNRGLLFASNTLIESDIFIICVPTPFEECNDKKIPNLEFVKSAVEEIARVAKPGNLIILESTSPVGTTNLIRDILQNQHGLSNLLYAHCPERVLPGNILYELEFNNRVIGGIDSASSAASLEFYNSFSKGELIITDAKSAEMVKLVENSFRDTNIAFANEISMICDEEDINVSQVIAIANKHPRVNVLDPGVGVGGHCIAVDPWFIISKHFENSQLLQTSRLVNLKKTDWVTNKILAKITELKDLSNSKISVGIYGLTFKPKVDDIRESPALKIANELSKHLQDIDLNCIDPNLNSLNNLDLNLISIDESIVSTDLKIFLVKHSEFCEPKFKESVANHKILDFCDIF